MDSHQLNPVNFIQLNPVNMNLNKYLKIMKVAPLAIILIVLALTGVYAGNLQFQFGSYVARAVGTSGRVQIVCTGGSGNYNYQITGLPAGWTVSNNIITVPNINSIQGQSFSVSAVVRDGQTGQVLNANVVLTINGVRIDVSNGGVVGGTFGVGSVASVSTSSSSNVTFTPTVSVASLYSSYSGLPSGTQIPTPSPAISPVGAPSIPNPAPRVIATAQAPFNQARDTNRITVEEVKRTAIFNRQLTANKAVANLVSIVQRLTSNVNAATNDVNVLTNLLSSAESAYNACQGEVLSLSNIKAQIENAIADRETQVADAFGKVGDAEKALNNLKKGLDGLISERNAIEKAKSPNANRLAQLESELADCVAKKNGLTDQLNAIRDQIAGTNSDIQNAKDSASAAPAQIAQIDRQLPIINDRIADLERQLADAKVAKRQLETDRAKAQGLIDAANAEVARLQKLLAGLQSRIPGLQSQIAATQANCDAINKKLGDFRQQLAGIQDTFNTLLQEIAGLQALIDSKQSQIAGLKDKITGLTNELKLLRAEHERVDSSIRRQLFICQDAAENVRRAKQNLDAMRSRLSSDSVSLSNANINLEAARAEKELADLAVEEIISTYTSALPFAIVPNGNGATNPGTPFGNNPSGSPLGPVLTAEQRAAIGAQATIGNLNTYLSSAYRAGVDPARPSTVTQVYPLSVATISTLVGDGSRGLQSFSCGRGASSYYGSGVVNSVQTGSINVNSNGQNMDLFVSGCSNLETVNQGQVLSAGDQVYFRGNVASGNSVHLDSLTCV